MKKTVKINIGGVIFHLDEDAFELLQNYLTAINQRFVSNTEGKEIISDIEHRIAEILQSKLTDQKEVISKEDINEIIGIMGKPEEFESEEENSGNESFQYNKSTKRLYRDPDNRVLGGVCAGLGTYLNIDPIIIRLIFILLMFGFGIIGFIYIVLWALLPAANSTSQKLDMRGERLNISDIEKNVRKEYESVKDNLKNFKDSKDYDRTRNFFESIIHAIGAFIRFIFKFIVAVFGLVLVVLGVGFLIGLTGTLIIGESFMPWNNIFIDNQVIFSDIINSVVGPNTLWIFTIAAILVVFIPLVAIIYGGFKLLLGIRPKDKPVAGIGFAVWLLSLITLVIIVGLQVKHFSVSVNDEERIEIKENTSKILYLKAHEDQNVATSRFYIFDEEFQIMYDENDDKQLLAFPEIDIIRGNSDQVIIEVRKKGRGSDRREALENAEDIEYHVVQQDSVVLFDAVYSLVDRNRWRFPEVDVTVWIPKGQIIYIDKNLEDQLDYIKYNHNNDYYRRKDIVNKPLIMTEDGLEKYYKVSYDKE